jgi:hypothetical protein
MEASSVSYEVERVFIYDLFICFPWLAGEIEGTKKIEGFTKARNLIRRTYQQGEYERIPEPWTMQQRIRPAQLAALNSLSSYGFIDVENWKAGVVVRTVKVIPAEIKANINFFLKRNCFLFEYIIGFLDKFEMKGKNGLKAKTGLEEYRYDYV